MIKTDALDQPGKLALPARERWVDAFEWLLQMLTAAMVLFIMGLTFVDVFCRYVFAVPIKGSEEMVKYAMAILVFSAFPLVTFREEHISVGLLQDRLHGAAKWVQRLFVLLVSALACGMMGWQLAKNGIEMVAEDNTTMVLGWQLGYLNYVMSAMSMVACIAVLALLLLHCSRRQA